jgi:phosphoglucomutase
MTYMEKQNCDECVKKLRDWLANPALDGESRRELEALNERYMADENDAALLGDIRDRFYRDLEFGTAGMRGVLGGGTNRMNVPVIERATQGFALHVREKFPPGKLRSCAIAYDTRHNSRLFAEIAKKTLEENGISVYLFSEETPVPVLSFAIPSLGAGSGIAITASHNPKEYNGYKIYDETGCQCLPAEAESVIEKIGSVQFFARENAEQKADENRFAGFNDKKIYADYLAEVLKKNRADASRVHVVYTPLNGTGNKFVRKILADIGVRRVSIVKEQENPDENFTTAPYPNPEEKEALSLALKLCEKLRAEGDAPDILLATDPDADRTGAAVYHGGEYRILTGNEVGILLFDYLIEREKKAGRGAENLEAITTVVSAPLFDKIAAASGVKVHHTFTGFKNIGNIMNGMKARGRLEKFIFAYEESCGYLIGDYARDKDSIGTCMAFAEMASARKAEGALSLGTTLLDRLEELYETFGYGLDRLVSFTMAGESGLKKIGEMMDEVKESKGENVFPGRVERFSFEGAHAFFLRGGSRVCFRASGTEPKLKAYISVNEKTRGEAERKLSELENSVLTFAEDF